MEEELKTLRNQLFELRMSEKLLSMDNDASLEQKEKIEEQINEVRKGIARVQAIVIEEKLNNEERRKI